MPSPLLRLYPQPTREEPLKGLYLSHNLRDIATIQDKAFVYSDYVTSLDGRIAVPHPTKPGLVVPDNVANPRDWRLFQELAVQADVLITSGRYLRDYADGRAQEILKVYDDPQFSDLVEWREEQGLPRQPDFAVVSGSLDFPIPDALIKEGRKVTVVTARSADIDKIKEIECQGAGVVIAGENSVSGASLIEALTELGYRVIDNTTGPKVLHLLLEDRALDRLYLTFAHRILGGKPFSSIMEGEILQPAQDLSLNTLYYDPHGLDGLGQLFASYNTIAPS